MYDAICDTTDDKLCAIIKQSPQNTLHCSLLHCAFYVVFCVYIIHLIFFIMFWDTGFIAASSILLIVENFNCVYVYCSYRNLNVQPQHSCKFIACHNVCDESNKIVCVLYLYKTG